MLSNLDQAIITAVSGDIPLVDEPFKELALRLGIEERGLFSRIQSYKINGLIRKFSAVVNHRKIGFKHNAMVVWNIPDKLVEKAGKTIATFVEVSHCYQRKKASGWNYNLYSMLHGKSKRDCLKIVKRISEKIGFKDYQCLFSSKEYKKSAVKYWNK